MRSSGITDNGGRPRRRGLRIGLWTVGLLAVAGVLYTAFWFVAAARLREAVTDWSAARRAEGDTVDYAGLRIGGFPLRLRAVFDHPRLATPGGGAAWSWAAPEAVLSVRPWALRRPEFLTHGPQQVGVPLAGREHRYTGTAGAVRIALGFAGGRLDALDADLTAIDLKGAAPGDRVSLGRANVTLAQTGMSDAGPDQPFASLTVDAQDLRGPAVLHLPLGETLSELRVDARVMGGIGRRRDRAAFAAWRDKGGTLEVDRLEVRYDALSLQASGTAALDAQMQPIGAFNARIRGFFETVERLRRTGAINDRAAVTAKLVLGVMAKVPADGGPPVLSLPISVQDRHVFVGPLDLFALPAVRWPGG